MPEAKDDHDERKEARRREAWGQFDQWMQVAVRFFVLANAGAAVATLSFIGATGAGFPWTAVVALACFVTGLVVAGVVIVEQLFGAYQLFRIRTTPDPRSMKEEFRRSRVLRLHDKVGRWRAHLLLGAFGSFVVGCVVGLVSLLLWCG